MGHLSLHGFRNLDSVRIKTPLLSTKHHDIMILSLPPEARGSLMPLHFYIVQLFCKSEITKKKVVGEGCLYSNTRIHRSGWVQLSGAQASPVCAGSWKKGLSAGRNGPTCPLPRPCFKFTPTGPSKHPPAFVQLTECPSPGCISEPRSWVEAKLGHTPGRLTH